VKFWFNLTMAVGVASTGFIVSHAKSWDLVWIICAGIYGFSVVVWLIFAKAHPLFPISPGGRQEQPKESAPKVITGGSGIY
jgi:hypothetical protein